ncbi:MAG: hypothetical protein II482_03280, partial [Lachnospiraceae bacterium]|nr:hypothetical protein [Lachnospiraceae bacterium]
MKKRNFLITAALAILLAGTIGQGEVTVLAAPSGVIYAPGVKQPASAGENSGPVQIPEISEAPGTAYTTAGQETQSAVTA